MYENSFTLKRMLAAYGKPYRFTGRSTRTELLGYLIVSWLVSAVLGNLTIFASIIGHIDLGFASFDIVNFLLWLPFPALAVRRFHDQNKPGWWSVPLVVPTIVAWLGGEDLLLNPAINFALAAVYLVALVLLFWKPTDGTNRYGPDPRLDAEDWDTAVAE